VKTDFDAQNTENASASETDEADKTADPTSNQDMSQSGATGPRPVFSWQVRVYYEDTDTGGIVYYANYLRFFERARTEWLRSLGISQQALFETDGLQFVVRSIDLQYLAPARLDDVLQLKMSLVAARRASLILNQTASLDGRTETLVSAKVRIAAINHTTGRPIGLPNWILERVNR